MSGEFPNRFKPGQSGNPAGRPGMPEEIKKLKKLNRAAYELLIDELMYMSIEQLQDLSKQKNVPAVKMAMASIIAKAISLGDHKRFGYLIEQMIGRALMRVEASGPDGTPLFAAARTPEERAARIREVQQALEKIKGAEASAASFKPADDDEPGKT